MKTIEAYPLCWPEGWKRTKHPQRSSFSINSDARARDELIEEIKRMGGRNIVLSTNIKLRLDGLPYSNQRNPDDSGVAIYFERKGEKACLACDKFKLIRENMWSLRKSIEALRGLERWGCSEVLNRAFKGFAQIEAPKNDPWEILETRENCFVTAEDNYKRLAKKYHPDLNNGNSANFLKIQEAIEKIRNIKKPKL